MDWLLNWWVIFGCFATGWLLLIVCYRLNVIKEDRRKIIQAIAGRMGAALVALSLVLFPVRFFYYKNSEVGLAICLTYLLSLFLFSYIANFKNFKK